MNKISPKASIIIATFNRAHFIAKMLDSLRNQSFKDWECLIIDDGSTDNTQEVLYPYLLKDSRFNYYERNENHKKGLPGCRNQGLELAKGEYIIFFDDDDIAHPDNLKTCVELLSGTNLFFCRYNKKPFFGEWNPGNFIKSSSSSISNVDFNQLENVIIGNLPFASCTVFWKKECFENIKFNEELLYAEEWECYTRILSTGIKGVSIDKVLYHNRKHPNSNTGEFYNNNPVRRASNVMAINLVIDHLSKNGLLSPKLVHFFIQTGFSIGDISVIQSALKRSNARTLKKLKYLLGFKFYPILKPIFKLKAKLKKS